MEEKILNYLELKPNIGYFTLCKIFGLPIKGILKLLDITNYKVYDNFGIRFYSENSTISYHEDNTGYWYIKEFNNNTGKLIHEDDFNSYERKNIKLHGVKTKSWLL